MPGHIKQAPDEYLAMLLVFDLNEGKIASNCQDNAG